MECAHALCCWYSNIGDPFWKTGPYCVDCQQFFVATASKFIVSVIFHGTIYGLFLNWTSKNGRLSKISIDHGTRDGASTRRWARVRPTPTRAREACGRQVLKFRTKEQSLELALAMILWIGPLWHAIVTHDNIMLVVLRTLYPTLGATVLGTITWCY